MTTYYVSPTGSDGDAGTTAAPFQTIAWALLVATNGDTIKLKAGTYRERGLSSSLNNLTITADTGAAPRWSASIQLSGFEIYDGENFPNVYWANGISGLYCAWNGATQLAVVVDVPTANATPNSCNENDGALFVNIGGDWPTTIEVLDANAAHITLTGSGATLSGITFCNAMMGPVLAGANATVTGCTFEYWMGFSADAIPFAEIVVTGSGATISGCSFTGNFTAYSWYNGSTCIGLDTTSDGATISDCTFTGGTNGLRVAGGTHVVEDCIFSNHRHTSASVIGGTLTARRCTATNNGHDGFNSETAGTTNLEHCLVNWTQETAAPISGAISGILFHANGSAYHCVVANLKRTTPGILPAYNLATTGNVAVKNCIAYNCVTGIGDSTDNTPPAGSYAQDYNCVNACTTAYQTGYAAGAHSISADPLFTNTTASSDDFHLLPASPCKNAGIAIAGVNDDYKGAAPDIGPYELASSAGKLTGAGRLGRWL